MNRRSWLQEPLWRWLRSHGPATPRAVCRAFKIKRYSASKCLQKLMAKGCVTRVGYGSKLTYTATAVKPEDMRGTAVNSVRTMQRYAEARRAPRGNTYRVTRLNY